jgi:hypothetical protein
VRRRGRERREKEGKGREEGEGREEMGGRKGKRGGERGRKERKCHSSNLFCFGKSGSLSFKRYS